MSEVGRPDIEAYALTNWLVGPFAVASTVEAAAEPTLAPWQMKFHDIALGALRRLAGQEHIPDGWTPAPVEGASLYRELAYERKLHSMIGGLKAYVTDKPSGAAITKFRANQYEITDTLYHAVEDVMLGDPIRVKSPTGSGKTAVIVGLTEGLKYHEQPSDEAGVLILVPRKDILGQTVATFAQFSQAIRPSVYFGEKKELGKVTVMTYQSFNNAFKAGVITRDMFDAVIRDESHRARGDEISRNLKHFIHGGKGDKPKAVFDMSATPKVKAEQLHYSMTVVEGIKRGILSPVSARRIYTGADITELEDRDFRDDFSRGEVRSLIHNRARNEIIVDEIVSGLRSGRRTIVRCLPGEDLAHPGIIQQMLAERGKIPIRNSYMEDREVRLPHVLTIRGDMRMEERKKIYKIFSEDMNFDLDVLLFVETMTEGWDGPIAKKLINAAPCRAEWLIEQLFGRVLRPYARHSGKIVTAQAVDLIDHSASGQVSFTNILDRDAPMGMRYREGVVVGKGLADLSDQLRTENGAFEQIAA